MAYLTIEEAQYELVASGLYTPETVPDANRLSRLLERLTIKMDVWLGYHPALMEYTEELKSNYQGKITLSNYPVLSVSNILVFNDYDPMIPPVNITEKPNGYWLRGTIVDIGIAERMMLITYTAGYDPIPAVIKYAFIDLLIEVLKNNLEGGNLFDLGFLDRPVQDVQSISVPGISKSWKLSGKDAGTEKSQLDRLLATLAESGFRRHYLF